MTTMKQTAHNSATIYLAANGYKQVTTAIRKQFAGVGFTYDHVRDEFVAPQPFESWTLDENNDWQPPTPKPDGHYYWNENLLVWVKYDKQKN
jgi:hypothetical protein